jgi:methionyl-tRNA formyltransferase
VRALDPHIGARIETVSLAGGLGVRAARVDAAGQGSGMPPGSLGVEDGRLYFAARDGRLELVRVQPPGGRPMSAADYIRGHAV